MAWSPVGEFADVIALGSKVCVVVVFVASRLSFWNGLTVNNHHVTSTLSLSLSLSYAQEKRGIGFDDYGGELELFNFSTSPTPTLLGSVKTATRFGSIAWGCCGTSSGGIIAGGMLDGVVNFWKGSELLNNYGGQSVQLASVQGFHGGGVSALKFNPHGDSMNMLARYVVYV